MKAKAEQDIITHFRDKLVTYGAKKHKREGTVAHLRLNVPEDIVDVFKKIGLKLEQQNTKIATGSSKFTTYQATLEKAQGNYKKGEKFYVVNTHSETSSIRKKALTPDKIGLINGPVAVSQVVKEVEAGLEKIVSGELLDYCKSLLKLSTADYQMVKTDPAIKDADIQQIAIDFGEIFGALWYARKKKAKYIDFPPEGNNPLVDFYLIYADGSKICVSSKVDAGGPPSMNAIVHVINQNKAYFQKHYDAEKLSVIRTIFDYGVVEGILEAHKLLNTDSYKACRRAGMKDWTKEGIEKWLRKFKTVEDMKKALEPVYVGFKPKRRDVKSNTIDIMFETDMKRYGLITSPLGYSLVDVMNQDEDFSRILNDAATRITADQLYTSLTRSDVKFTVKHFDTASFEWYFNANAKMPGLKKISFKMK